MLDFLRATVVMKVEGLTDEQAFATPVPPSTLTLAGVVKHLSATERFWFSIDFAGLDVPWPYRTTTRTATSGWRRATRWRRSSTSTNASASGPVPPSPARTSTTRRMGEGMTFNLRYALTHMIEETARHCGHLDLLREVTDGRTGQ